MTAGRAGGRRESGARSPAGGRAGSSARLGRTGSGARPGDGGIGAARRRWRLVRAGRAAVPASTRRFMRRSRQRRIRAAVPWMVVAGVVALAGLAAWIVLGTGLLGVRQVEVAGVEIVTAAQVREAAAVQLTQPMASLDRAAVSGRVAQLPAVERVRVVRDWPATVVIEVVERTAVAVVPQDRGYLVVDGSGVVFRSLTQRPSGLPVVRVAAPGPDDPATRAALSVLAVLPPQLRDRLTEVSVAGPARVSLRLAGGRTVFWGDPSQNALKARIASALLNRPSTTIDVSAPDVVAVQEAPPTSGPGG